MRMPARGRKEVGTPVARDDPKSRKPYVRPRLERIGNVRDVLGKTGPSSDNPRPRPRRP